MLGYEVFPGENRLGIEAVRVELFRRDVDNPRPRYENLLEPLNFFPEIEPDRVRIAPAGNDRRGSRAAGAGAGRAAALLVGGVLLRPERGPAARRDGPPLPRSAPHRDGARRPPPAAAVEARPGLALPHRLAHHAGDRRLRGAGRRRGGRRRELPEPELVAVFGDLNRPAAAHLPPTRPAGQPHLEPAQGPADLLRRRAEPLRPGEPGGLRLSVDEEAGIAELEPEHWPGIFPSIGVPWGR